MKNLTLFELRTIAKMRSIRGYRGMSKERLISFINQSEVVNFDDTRIEKTKKDFDELIDRLSKPTTKEIRKGLYGTENKKTKENEKKTFLN